MKILNTAIPKLSACKSDIHGGHKAATYWAIHADNK